MSVATSYIDLKTQIKALEEQAEAARKSELKAIIEDIKLKMSAYGIGLEDLGFESKASSPKLSNGQKRIAKQTNDVGRPKVSVPPKYRSADGAKTWSGRGISPKWVTAHVQEGGKLADLLINKKVSAAS